MMDASRPAVSAPMKAAAADVMDNARKKRKYRAIVACLLLLTMMPFFFVKAFHVHKEDLCISHDEQQSSHHDSADKCAICLFTLSSFTEAESFEYNCVQTENPVEYLIQKDPAWQPPARGPAWEG